MYEEHRNLFRDPTRHARVPFNPYSRTRPTRPQIWKHNFLCLASRYTVHVPSQQQKENLLAMGLGEKRIHLGLQASAVQLEEKLLMVYPKLHHAGGYDLLRCLPNSRSLSRLVPPEGGFTPLYLKGEVGQARLYVRPLMRDLSIVPSTTVGNIQVC